MNVTWHCSAGLFRIPFTGDLSNLNQLRSVITPNHASLSMVFCWGYSCRPAGVRDVRHHHATPFFIRCLKPIADIIPVDPRNPLALRHLIREVEKGVR